MKRTGPKRRLQRPMSMAEAGALIRPDLAASNPNSARVAAIRYLRGKDPHGRWFRRCGPHRNSPYKVTMAQLRRFCPELFSGRDELVMMLLPHLNEFREWIAANKLDIRQCIQELEDLKRRLDRVGNPNGSERFRTE